MADGFLDIVERNFGNGGYAGDEYGGASGTDGRGLPTGSASNFMFATGIECSNPTIDHGKTRRDQLLECGHYDRWRDDLRLTVELGLKVLRYGLPIHRVWLGPGKFDWEFADLAMAEMQRLDIIPILDLCHFGVPDWVGNFQNPDFPMLFHGYCDAVAERYPWVRYYTPVNEIYVTARLSAKDGLWNEQTKDDRSFCNALKHCVAASILGNQAIAKRRPDCVIVQSESAEYVHEAKATVSDAVRLQNKQRFISLDLLYAFPFDAEVANWMYDNGLTRKEYDWFMAGEPPGYQVMGNDYYGHNEKILKPDGSMCPAEDVLGWYNITRAYHDRYRKPVMHTETNISDNDAAPTWLWKQWMNILKMRRDNVPVLGFTWYSLIDQIDWDSALSVKNNNVNACGLYDLDRNPRPVAAAYRALLEEFGQITIVPHGEMFETTTMAAKLKVEV